MPTRDPPAMADHSQYHQTAAPRSGARSPSIKPASTGSAAQNSDDAALRSSMSTRSLHMPGISSLLHATSSAISSAAQLPRPSTVAGALSHLAGASGTSTPPPPTSLSASSTSNLASGGNSGRTDLLAGTTAATATSGSSRGAPRLSVAFDPGSTGRTGTADMATAAAAGTAVAGVPLAHRRARSSSNSPLPSASLLASAVPQQLMSLSGVLNDPKALKFTKLDLGGAHIPAVPVKKVRIADFDAYIKGITGYYDRYEENRRQGIATAAAGVPMLFPEKSSRSGRYADPRDDPDSPSASLYSLIGMGGGTSSHRGSLAQLAQAEGAGNTPRDPSPEPVAPLSSVPAVYFQPDFTLENPRIFDAATAALPLTDLDPALQLLATHTDTVESHLTREIAARSPSFFSALANLTDLHAETTTCVSQVAALRAKLQVLAAVHARTALETVTLTRRRARVAAMVDTAAAMMHARDAAPAVHALIRQSDYAGALAVLADATKIAAPHPAHATAVALPPSPSAVSGPGLPPHPPPPPPAFVMPALSSMQSRLAELGRTLATVAVSELVDAFLESARADPGSAGPMDGSAHMRLVPLVKALVRIDGVGVSLAGYQDRLVIEVKSLVRKTYPPDLRVDGTAPSQGRDAGVPPFIKALKSLTLEKFLGLLTAVFRACHALQTRLVTTHATFVGALGDAEAERIRIGVDKHLVGGTIASLPPPFPGGAGDDSANDEFRHSGVPDARPLPPTEPGPTTYAGLATASIRVVNAATDAAHARCAKLVAARAEQNAQLSLKDFVRLYAAAAEFMATTEAAVGELAHLPSAATSGGSSSSSPIKITVAAASSGTSSPSSSASAGPTALKVAIQGQARAFVVHFHMERMKQLGMLIEVESWSQAEVLVDFQKIFDRIADPNGSVDARRRRHLLAIAGSPMGSDEGGLNTSGGSGSNKPDGAATASVSKALIIGNTQFPIASVVLMLGKMIDEYLQVVAAIPAMAMDIHSKLCELLRLFNSRSCQMILGAGAVQSAGLKSISAKHLAITSQTLATVLALIPSIKATMAANFTDRQTAFLGDYDKVTKDYTDHQAEVYAKLVAIMEERVVSHARALGVADWDAMPVPDPGAESTSLPPPSPAMEALVKETTTLHKVLARYLPPETLKAIMTRVFERYNTHLESDLGRIMVASVNGKTALLIDVQYFIRKLNALEGCDGPGSHLEVVVNNMRIGERPPPVVSVVAADPSSPPPTLAGSASALPVPAAPPAVSSSSSSGDVHSHYLSGFAHGSSIDRPASAAPGVGGNPSSSSSFATATHKISASMSGFNIKSWTSATAANAATTSGGTASPPPPAPPGPSSTTGPVGSTGSGGLPIGVSSVDVSAAHLPVPAGSSSLAMPGISSTGSLPGGSSGAAMATAGSTTTSNAASAAAAASGVAAAQAQAAMADAALKTKQMASDWMKKMSFK
ncbi:hypothetical protein BC828DRAFT_241260 [Blastocladiella britannica]|nr:hypothetical protein BC828DRAFT_241260 [Blastocladiella britannica]